MKKKNKKSQMMYLDLFFGLIIFIILLEIVYSSGTNLSTENEKHREDLLIEAEFITSSLLTQGTPLNWTKNDVEIIGISENHRINELKLDDLAEMDYPTIKSKLRTKYDFYLFFEDNTNIIKIPYSGGEKEGIGKESINSVNVHETEKPNNLIKITRLVILQSKPARMVVYVWD